MSVSLNKEAYLATFSYMPKPAVNHRNWMAIKAISYIPVLGTISCLFISAVLRNSAVKEEDCFKREACWLVGNYFVLRAALSLVAPLLLVVEAITTLVDAILPPKTFYSEDYHSYM